jgi:DNA-binding response OmpR family regulator
MYCMKVFMLSARGQECDHANAMAKGADACFVKPSSSIKRGNAIDLIFNLAS